MNQLENKRILVVGMGKSGIAATQALLKLGAVVSVYDRKEEDKIDTQLIQFLRNKKVTCYFGEEPDNTGELDMVVISPGVPTDTGFVLKAKEAGAEVIGEMEIAYRVGSGKYVCDHRYKRKKPRRRPLWVKYSRIRAERPLWSEM